MIISVRKNAMGSGVSPLESSGPRGRGSFSGPGPRCSAPGPLVSGSGR